MANVQELLEKDIFELLHLEGASDEQKEALINKMNESVQARIVVRMASQVSEEEAQQFAHLAENNDQEGMKQFISEHGLDLAQMAAEEALKFRIELAETLDLATGAQPE